MAEATDNWTTMHFVAHVAGLRKKRQLLKNDHIMTAEGGKAALHMSANAHLFCIKGEKLSGPFPRSMATFNAVLMIAKYPNDMSVNGSLLDLNRKDQDILNCTPFGDDPYLGPWEGEARDDGSLKVYYEGLSRQIDEAYIKGETKASITSKIAPTLTVILAILLHKMNHYFMSDKVRKMIQLLDGNNTEVLRTSFRIAFSTERCFAKVMSAYLHPSHVVVKKALTISKGLELISSCNLTSSRSVLAKLEVLCALISESQVDAALRCFLMHMKTKEEAISIHQTQRVIYTPQNAVAHYTMISDLAGKNFADCKTIVDKFELEVIIGCLMYIGGFLADQIPFGEGVYNLAWAILIRDYLTQLKDALSAKVNHLTILSPLLTVAKPWEEEKV